MTGERFCRHCGSTNKTAAKFCRACGKRMGDSGEIDPPGVRVICSNCGALNRPDANFCLSCGHAPTGIFEPVFPKPGEMVRSLTARKPKAGEVKLVIHSMGGAALDYPLDGASLTVGRKAGNDVIIDHHTVSSHHLKLAAANNQYFVTDLNSTNGTLVNGKRIQPGASQPLNLGDVIRIGDLHGNWVALNLEIEGQESMQRLAAGQLDVSSLSQGTIGRSPDSFLPLSHPTVSYRHAVLLKQDGRLTIRDLGSSNGTFINGRRIQKAPVVLKHGDTIQIGAFRLIYDAHNQRLSQWLSRGYRIEAIDVGRWVEKGRMILEDIDLTINPGEFVAFVGGSGAGKSTLLKAMNGYEPATQGQVLIDGEPLYSRLDLYRMQMGYVPQDDIIHRVLPVRLALWYSAKLRLPDARPAEIETRIQEALKSVDLVEHASKRVRVLSGGQRKRVSIASELLAHPALFFLDEPTTGLDPGLEKKMMYDLARLADEGRAVVLVTHATANIAQCDQVAFLAEGKLAYYGTPDEALKYFNVRDFADIYLKLSQEIDPALGKNPSLEIRPFLSQVSSNGGRLTAGLLWAERYRQSAEYQGYIQNRQQRLADEAALPLGRKKTPPRSRDSFLRQAYILTRRQIDLIRFDLRTLLTLLLIVPLIGIMFGGVSHPYSFKGEVTYEFPEKDTFQEVADHFKEQLRDKQPGASGSEILHAPYSDAHRLITMVSLAVVQAGTFIAAYEIVKEKAIFRRERAVNLKVLPYLLSKAIVLAGVGVFHVLSMLAILRLFGVDMDLPGAVFARSASLELFVTFYLGIVAGIMFGLLISTLMPSSDMVLLVVLIQLFAQIILNGATFAIENPAVSQMTLSYWTVVGMGSTVDLPKLNRQGMVCKAVEISDPQTGTTANQVQCSESRAKLRPGGTPENRDGDYKHSPGRVILTWIFTAGQGAFYFMLSLFFLGRRR